jgi:cyclic pyranopterin phosphate synthase
VLAGLDAAQAAGLSVKINAVALRGENQAELPGMVAWAHARGMALTFIETMPLGDTGEDRTAFYLPLTQVRAELSAVWTLSDLTQRTPRPARYMRVEETGGVVGFITPADPQLLRGLQPGATHLHRQALSLPRAGGLRRSSGRAQGRTG